MEKYNIRVRLNITKWLKQNHQKKLNNALKDNVNTKVLRVYEILNSYSCVKIHLLL